MSNSNGNLLENVPLEPLPTTGKEYPLSNTFKDTPHAGSLFIYCGTDFSSLKTSLEGVFSFVYYYKPSDNHNAIPADFLNTLWYKGLQIYLDIVHDPVGTVERGVPACASFLNQFIKPDGTLYGDEKEQKIVKQAIETPPLATEDVQRFLKWGVVIYTDAKTQALLRGVFPLSKYPKLVLAVVNWPFYSVESGVCEATIMRCLRFQSAELFQGKTICIRDADTLFVNRIDDDISKKNPEYIQYMVLWWEIEFLKPWITEYGYHKRGQMYSNLHSKERHIIEHTQCIIGTASWYRSEWHTNFPIKFPISEKTEYWHFYAPDSTFSASRGVFAGFVNISKEVHRDIWGACVQYLIERYFIGISYGKRTISDAYCRSIAGALIGKDERLLLFVFPTLFHGQQIEYYPIEYSVGSSTAAVEVNAPFWPAYLAKAYNATGYTGEFNVKLEHLLTPYYNKGVYETKVTLVTDKLRETIAESFKRYQEFKTKLNIPKETIQLTEKLATCNPAVAKEDLFLKEAGIVPQEAFTEQLNAPVRSLSNLQQALEAKNAARLAKFPHLAEYKNKRIPVSQLLGGRRGRTQKRGKAQRRETRKA